MVGGGSPVGEFKCVIFDVYLFTLDTYAPRRRVSRRRKVIGISVKLATTSFASSSTAAHTRRPVTPSCRGLVDGL